MLSPSVSSLDMTVVVWVVLLFSATSQRADTFKEMFASAKAMNKRLREHRRVSGLFCEHS